jgi:hypothetical protein
MSALNASQRGDLAEAMLPVAAHLAILVHGDGGPEDVRDVIQGLTGTEKNALIVVLAGLVDPDQPVGKALGWLGFDEHGEMVVPTSWSERSSVRDLAPEATVEADDEYVDHNAVARFVRGFRVEVTDADFLAGVQQCAALGMSSADIDRLRRWPVKTTENWINRLRKRYQRSGRVFPDLGFVKGRAFSEEDVVSIRERAQAGTADVLLAVEFDVERETIRAIVRGQRYANFGGPIRKTRSQKALKASRDFMCGHSGQSQAAGFQAKNAALTPEERFDIRQRTDDGEAVRELAGEYQVHTNTIRRYAA